MYHAYNSSIILAKYSFYIHICILLTSSYILVVVVVFRRGSILFVFELTCSFYQLMFWKFQMPAKSNSWYPCPNVGAPQRQPHISLHSPTVCLKKYLKQCYCFPHLTPLPPAPPWHFEWPVLFVWAENTTSSFLWGREAS